MVLLWFLFASMASSWTRGSPDDGCVSNTLYAPAACGRQERNSQISRQGRETGLRAASGCSTRIRCAAPATPRPEPRRSGWSASVNAVWAAPISAPETPGQQRCLGSLNIRVHHSRSSTGQPRSRPLSSDKQPLPDRTTGSSPPPRPRSSDNQP